MALKANSGPKSPQKPEEFDDFFDKVDELVVFHQPMGKNVRKSNWIISPIFGVNKNISNHHLGEGCFLIYEAAWCYGRFLFFFWGGVVASNGLYCMANTTL